MKRSREELEADLVEKAAAMIAEYLDWHEGTERPTLTDIEDQVLQLRTELSMRMVEVVAADQGTSQPVQAAPCPGCGKTMHNKGGKVVSVGSRVGAVQMKRSYYYCPSCQSGYFPPG